ncbi:MAG TPA: hypothetical protein VKA84_14470 [Gemmatimonadaceae bacterium]|nr:hypothetical protein [Gemmatimonadaceae bacterium]
MSRGRVLVTDILERKVGVESIRGALALGVLAALAVACGGDGNGGTGPGDGRADIRVVAGGGIEDTVLAAPDQALVVEVTDGHDRRPGLVVRFEPLAPEDSTRRQEQAIGVCPLTAQRCGAGTDPFDPFFSSGAFAADTTDASGRAKVLVRLGTVAGPARVAVTVPELGIRDTVNFTVRAGQAAKVRVLVKDTTVFGGATYSVGGALADRFGNARTETVSFRAGGHVVVDESGRLTAVDVGRGFVIASRGELADTSWASVVPRGTLVALREGLNGAPNSIVTFDLDGSSLRQVAPTGGGSGTAEGIAPTWSPAGDRILYHEVEGSTLRMFTTDLAGSARRAIAPGALTWESWGEYSRDGQFIYFSGTTITPGQGQIRLWRALADGTGLQQLGGSGAGSVEWRPSVSPDDSKLVFISTRSGGVKLHVLNLASGAVTSLNVEGQTPRWSPTGELIAYSTQYGGPIRVIRPDGTGARIISASGRVYAEGPLTWSPDGRWVIAPVAGFQGGGYDLIGVNDGITLPLRLPARVRQPSWKR